MASNVKSIFSKLHKSLLVVTLIGSGLFTVFLVVTTINDQITKNKKCAVWDKPTTDVKEGDVIGNIRDIDPADIMTEAQYKESCKADLGGAATSILVAWLIPTMLFFGKKWFIWLTT